MQKSSLIIRKIACVCIAVCILISLVGCAQTAEAPSQSTPAAPAATETPSADESPSAQEHSTENMVQNGDFSDGTKNWSMYLAKGGAGELKVENETGIIDIKNPGTADYAVQLYYDGFKLETGGVYRFAFDMSCTMDRNIAARLQVNGGDYSPYIEEFVDITGDMKRYEFELDMQDGTDPAPRLCFNIGKPQDGSDVGPCVLSVDNVEVTLTDASGILAPEPEPVRPQVNINQLGYAPDDTKIAVFRGEGLGDTFQVLDKNGSVALEGALTGPIENASAGETNFTGDFTKLNKPGEYHIVCGSATESYAFKIGDDIYNDALKGALQMLYLQRCGCALDSTTAGEYAHEACHTGEAIIYGTQDKKDVSGGWHDAGDYGRYVVPGAKTVADLIFAYKDFEPVLGVEKGDAFGIPESGNGIPDVLDEARYELEWMQKMQAESGGVYHKVTALAFPESVMPTEETEQLYLLPVSITATGDFCAVMAMASQVYEPFDKAFAKQCLNASLKAWDYLQANNSGSFKNPEDVLTGEYPDGQNADERCWAAAALYSVTGKAKYNDAFIKYLNLSPFVLDGYGWADVGGYGNRIYMSLDASKIDAGCVAKIKESLTKKLDGFAANAKKDGYASTLGSIYPWGSNMSICNNAIYMYNADKLLGKDSATLIDSQLNYIFGVNPMSTCYLTGFGTTSPKNPHHRPSMAVGTVMPGMLVGGPNSNLEDPFAKAVLSEAPPAKCYADNAQSYSCNEVAIYWNSPLVYLIAEHMSK